MFDARCWKIINLRSNPRGITYIATINCIAFLKLILLLCCMYIEQLIFKLYSKTLLNLLSSCIIEFSMCTNMLSR